MDSRRKPVIRTYGKSAKNSKLSTNTITPSTDNFDMLFSKRNTSQLSELVKGRVPLPGEDPFDFAASTADESTVAVAKATSQPVKRPSPSSFVTSKPDPFAFADDDNLPSTWKASTSKPLPKKAKAAVTVSTVAPTCGAAPATVVSKPQLSRSSNKTVSSVLYSDRVLKLDTQMKIDSFAVALPKLKAAAASSQPAHNVSIPVVCSTSFSSSFSPPSTSAISSSSLAGVVCPRNPVPTVAKSIRATLVSVSPTGSPPAPPKLTSLSLTTATRVPAPIPVVQPPKIEMKKTEPERKIFTTERGDRRKVANPRSWFASDDDEDEDYPGAGNAQSGGGCSLGSNNTASTSGGRAQALQKASSLSSTTTVVDASGKRSVRVHRSEKDNFAVIKHVRGVSELQAEGSSLEYDGDYNYLVECLGSGAQLSSRCLSALQLASKCAETSDFRLYLKSTGKLSEVFEKLEDSHKYDLLALCSAAIFVVLSSDRSQVDLNTDALRLLVALVKASGENPSTKHPSATSSFSPSKWKTNVPPQIVQRVTTGIGSILKSLQRKYGADFSFAPVDSPNVISQMALSALHVLSHRCSSESMQNDFRDSGALEILVEDCVSCLKNPDMSQDDSASYAKKAKQLISGILKLIVKNKESKRLASESNNCSLPRGLAHFTCSVLSDAKTPVIGENESRLLSQCYNLLMVLCCDTKTTCGILASECPDFVSASARLAIIGNNSLEAVHSHFDLSILSFFVLVNIFEFSPVAAAVCHPCGSDGPSLVTLLIEFFNFLCAAAVDCEREADEQISSSQQAKKDEATSSKSSKLQRPSSSMEVAGSLSADDGALDAMLQAAGTRHMELNFLAACCCIVVFYAVDIEPKSVESIRKNFVGANFDLVVDVLKRFLTFTALVNGADDRTLETVAKILEKYDATNKAAGFGLAAENPGLPALPVFDGGRAPSSSNAAAAGSSFNWATPPGTSGDSSGDDTNSGSDRLSALRRLRQDEGENDSKDDAPYVYMSEDCAGSEKAKNTDGVDAYMFESDGEG